MIDIVRSPEPPELQGAPVNANTRSVRWPEAVKRTLYDDALGKCYLCEGLVDLSAFEVEHRVQKHYGEEWVKRWSNLFVAHDSCNSHRPRSTPDGGWASPGDDVEGRLIQRAEFAGGVGLRCEFRAVKPDDIAAENTSTELSELHNARKVHSADLRSAISIQLARLLKLQADVMHLRFTGDDAPKLRELEANFSLLLRKDQPYTMLMRSVIHKSVRDLIP